MSPNANASATPVGDAPPPLTALPAVDASVEANADLRCPLCGYDLRGLAEHRCPECGHAFDPDELRQAKADRAEWRFETAPPRRRVQAFALTSLATLRPFRFWRELSAAQTIVPGRLVQWARLWLGICAFAVIGSVALAAVVSYIEVQGLIAGGAPRFGPVRGGYMRIDDTFGGALWHAFLRSRLSSDLWMAFAILTWPPMAVLASQLFGLTLRRASIHRGHLWRCVLYAWPMMALPCVLLLVAAPYTDVNARSPYSWPIPARALFGDSYEPPQIVWQLSTVWHIAPLALLATMLAASLSTVHLVAAHVRYLRLPHAAAQAVLVQAVAWLLIASVVHLCSVL